MAYTDFQVSELVLANFVKASVGVGSFFVPRHGFSLQIARQTQTTTTNEAPHIVSSFI
jgi:hypothetical protein